MLRAHASVQSMGSAHEHAPPLLTWPDANFETNVVKHFCTFLVLEVLVAVCLLHRAHRFPRDPPARLAEN